MQNAAQREDVVEDDAVGDEVVVLDELTLLLAVIGRDCAITAERDPLRGTGRDPLGAFLDAPVNFQEVRSPERKQVGGLPELQAYLAGITLDELLAQLKALGITQKAFTEGICMNPRHLGAIKSRELRNHFVNELGTTKLSIAIS